MNASKLSWSTVSLYVHVINIHPFALKQQKKPSLPNVGGPLHVPFNKFKIVLLKKNVGPFEASMGTTTLVDIVISPRDSWCCVHASQTVIANILSVHYHTVPACSCNNYTETKVIISSIHI